MSMRVMAVLQLVFTFVGLLLIAIPAWKLYRAILDWLKRH